MEIHFEINFSDLDFSALLNVLMFVKINFKLELDDHKDKPRMGLNQTKTPFGGKKKKEKNLTKGLS